jgi:CRISPR-associated endonuclease/helicase Cas3
MKEKFALFYEQIHGVPPFPWQIRLLHEVLENGWPETLSLPTASGKTAVMDVAVFALACDVRMPRRIALVVDRRIVVDDAYRRACKIRDSIKNATDGVLKEVGDNLRKLGGTEDEPVQAAQLRGGIYREDRWARTPVQPVILCSTVDQVGSRLLFRGYGISSSMWPVHAGLMGNDCLIVLDEAHCSEPFRQTLEWVSRLRGKAEKGLQQPFSIVTMTATPKSDVRPFQLEEEDCAHPVLQKRIEARKLSRLTECKNLVAESLKAVEDLIYNGATALVVVNRVKTARAIRDKLRKKKKICDAILLTGRCRPLERDALLERWKHRVMAGRSRDEVREQKPLVIVATQCVEVGADLDADVLITECCSLDALRQRFGRLDRLGELGESAAAVLIDEKQVGRMDSPVDDPIYGTALSRTWHWLIARKGDSEDIDLGISSLEDLSVKEAVTLGAPTLDAPIIFPAYCDLWVQTGPEPAVSPETGIFLHGPQRETTDVRIVWRADLGEDPGTWVDTVSLCPPTSGESLALPLWIARQWLSESPRISDEYGDTEGNPENSPKNTIKECREALRWFGPEKSETITSPDKVCPGDTLVVPSIYGGCDEEGWNEKLKQPCLVTDVATEARASANRPLILRLHPALVKDGDPLSEFATLKSEDEWPDDLEDKIIAAKNFEKKNWRIEAHPSGVGVVLIDTGRVSFTDEDSTSGRATKPVTLQGHLYDVECRVKEFCTFLGLSRELTQDLVLAARLHDIGKTDPRFQAWLAGGSRLRARQNGLLAKSSWLPVGSQGAKEARKKAGYPKGGRHELVSVRMLESAEGLLASAHDPDLVLHLIASHHGRCRPFAPVVDDKRPLNIELNMYGQVFRANSATELERLDSGIAERFWKLTHRYGWWGLAGLETCLRLADHRASEKPSQEKRL